MLDNLCCCTMGLWEYGVPLLHNQFSSLFSFHHYPPSLPLPSSPPLLGLCLLPGLIHVDKRLTEIKAQLEQGEEVKGGLLTHMLITKEMNMEEIYANLTEMLLAGVDTVCVCVSVFIQVHGGVRGV